MGHLNDAPEHDPSWNAEGPPPALAESKTPPLRGRFRYTNPFIESWMDEFGSKSASDPASSSEQLTLIEDAGDFFQVHNAEPAWDVEVRTRLELIERRPRLVVLFVDPDGEIIYSLYQDAGDGDIDAEKVEEWYCAARGNLRYLLSNCDIISKAKQFAHDHEILHSPEMDEDADEEQREREIQNALQVIAGLKEDDLWETEPDLARTIASAKNHLSKPRDGVSAAFSVAAFLEGSDDDAANKFDARHLRELFTTHSDYKFQNRETMRAFARRVNDVLRREGLRLKHPNAPVGRLKVSGTQVSPSFAMAVGRQTLSIKASARCMPSKISLVPAQKPDLVNH